MEQIMNELSFFAMECLDCGWDWIGGFAVCTNCRGSNVKLVEEISDSKMFDRLYWINLKSIKGFGDAHKAIDVVDKMFNQGWERE